MPSVVGFTVDRYQLDCFQHGPDVTGTVIRSLRLIGDAAPTSSATLEFVNPPSGLPSIVHSTGWPPGSGGAVAIVRCAEAYFDPWYDLVRNERPLYCVLAYADADPDLPDPQRRLQYLRVSTGADEPPGEGPEGPP